MTAAEIREAISWYARDARYLSKLARFYRQRGRPADSWLASLVKESARRSMKLAYRYKAQVAA